MKGNRTSPRELIWGLCFLYLLVSWMVFLVGESANFVLTLVTPRDYSPLFSQTLLQEFLFVVKGFIFVGGITFLTALPEFLQRNSRRSA